MRAVVRQVALGGIIGSLVGGVSAAYMLENPVGLFVGGSMAFINGLFYFLTRDG